jgi:SRSO17 transposase
VEPRCRALAYLRGLLSQVERKNSWWLAEQAGEQTPDGMQRLLSGSGWDADGVRDDLCDYVVEQLGQAMLERALAAGVPFGWVTGDTVYGGDRRLRIWLEEHTIRHVMAVKCTEPVWALTDRGPGQVAAQDLIAEVEPAQWLGISAGDGSKGKRFYDWTRVPLWRWAGRPTWGSGCWPAAAAATLASWPPTSAWPRPPPRW